MTLARLLALRSRRRRSEDMADIPPIDLRVPLPEPPDRPVAPEKVPAMELRIYPDLTFDLDIRADFPLSLDQLRVAVDQILGQVESRAPDGMVP